MALPTGRHAELLSLRAKLLKAHILADKLGFSAISERCFADYVKVDAKIGTSPKTKTVKVKVEEDLEGDDATE